MAWDASSKSNLRRHEEHGLRHTLARFAVDHIGALTDERRSSIAVHIQFQQSKPRVKHVVCVYSRFISHEVAKAWPGHGAYQCLWFCQRVQYVSGMSLPAFAAAVPPSVHTLLLHR